jgi:NaMN:DMB phosphoribosyltransferase
MMAVVLGNTMLSTVPGISGAGPTPEKTLLTPVLDAELITNGAITSMPARPNTPTGCPTPASITRSMMELTGLSPIFINSGLAHTPTVPCLDVYGRPGGDPAGKMRCRMRRSSLNGGRRSAGFLQTTATS